eukprot:6108938-Amphidinium_carterae.2
MTVLFRLIHEHASCGGVHKTCCQPSVRAAGKDKAPVGRTNRDVAPPNKRGTYARLSSRCHAFTVIGPLNHHWRSLLHRFLN